LAVVFEEVCDFACVTLVRDSGGMRSSVKKPTSSVFVACRGSSSDDFAQEEEFVVYQGMAGAHGDHVVHERELPRHHVEADSSFTSRTRNTRRIAYIGPAAGQRPPAVFAFLDSSSLSSRNCRCSDVDFRRA